MRIYELKSQIRGCNSTYHLKKKVAKEYQAITPYETEIKEIKVSFAEYYRAWFRAKIKF